MCAPVKGKKHCVCVCVCVCIIVRLPLCIFPFRSTRSIRGQVKVKLPGRGVFFTAVCEVCILGRALAPLQTGVSVTPPRERERERERERGAVTEAGSVLRQEGGGDCRRTHTRLWGKWSRSLLIRKVCSFFFFITSCRCLPQHLEEPQNLNKTPGKSKDKKTLNVRRPPIDLHFVVSFAFFH